MLTPLRLVVLLVIAAVGPYVVSETDMGRSACTRFTNLFRSSGQKRSVDGQETYVSTDWSRAQSANQGVGQSGGFWSRFGGGSETGGSATGGSAIGGLGSSGRGPSTVYPPSDPRDRTYANHSHYEVEKLRGQEPDGYRYDQDLARKLGALPSGQQGPSLVGAAIPDMREVLRFDVSPDWVISRFSRVSTVLADLSMQGLRVPIVTGTQADDLAGTLTYYFDKQGKVQRLTLHGFTGSPQKIVSTMTSHYGLTHEPALEAGVYTKRWNRQPVHFLRLTHAPVIYSDAVHQKYTLFLELNHPNLAYGISNEARRIVTADHSTGRW